MKREPKMQRIEKTVFISYRRTNFPWAQAIYQSLTHQGYDVFFDFLGIASGSFEKVILGNIEARAHFLVLLTPSALERCVDPSDWLRREIEVAFDSKRNVVPLMLEGFDFGSPGIAGQLTGKLSNLKNYNALPVPAAYFDASMEQLRQRYLNIPLAAVLHPAPSIEEATSEQKAAADSASRITKEELTAQEWFERGFATDDLDEKIRLFTEAIRLQPDYALAFNNRANCRSRKGDYEGTLRDHNMAVRLRPRYAAYFYNRGLTRDHVGDLQGALEDYDEAIRLEPHLPFQISEVFHNRGTVRRSMEDFEGAANDYNEAIRLQPNFFNAFFNKGDLNRLKGNLDSAISDLNEAIRLQPSSIEALIRRGNVYRLKGNLKAAVQDYSEAIRRRPNAMAFTNRGSARAANNDLAGATKDYGEAIRLQPDLVAAFFNRGNAYLRENDLSHAIEDFTEVIRLEPDSADAFFARGEAHKRAGNLGAAHQDVGVGNRLRIPSR